MARGAERVLERPPVLALLINACDLAVARRRYVRAGIVPESRASNERLASAGNTENGLTVMAHVDVLVRVSPLS